MPRAYINAFPDVRGQSYERTVFAETQASPLDTAADIYGITGSVVTANVSGSDTVVPIVRRYRYRLGWSFLPTERAVDIEYAIEQCANGTGGPLAFIEWEVTDETDYPIYGSEGIPLFAFPFQTNDPLTGNIITPVHWWDIQSFELWQADVGDHYGGGWPTSTPSGLYTVTEDDSWLGNIPSINIDIGSLEGSYTMLGCQVTGRRIRMVTVDPDSYVREKARQPDLWSVSVTLIEKETGLAPGYQFFGSSDISIGGGGGGGFGGGGRL